MTLPGWTREPLVHFLALGALIYLALTWGGVPVDPSSRMISVDAEQRARLALGFERVMGRAPTDAELDARIDKYVREEVLYREALRLGLDQDDAIVRQRMVSKMDMSAGAAAELAEPDEQTLRAFFTANQERYAGARTTSFEQRFFPDKDAAFAALDALSAQGQASGLGQSTSLPLTMNDASLREVTARFGQQFAEGLQGVEANGNWHGPIPSGFGWHVVRVTDRVDEEPEFEGLLARIRNDWRSEQIEQRKQRAYEILRSAYRVDIDR